MAAFNINHARFDPELPCCKTSIKTFLLFILLHSFHIAHANIGTVNIGKQQNPANMQVFGTVLDKYNHPVVPAGAILMWSGSEDAIPKGWLICNGRAGTPDLRDRFIVGAGGKYAINGTGGGRKRSFI